MWVSISRAVVVMFPAMSRPLRVESSRNPRWQIRPYHAFSSQRETLLRLWRVVWRHYVPNTVKANRDGTAASAADAPHTCATEDTTPCVPMFRWRQPRMLATVTLPLGSPSSDAANTVDSLDIHDIYSDVCLEEERLPNQAFVLEMERREVRTVSQDLLLTPISSIFPFCADSYLCRTPATHDGWRPGMIAATLATALTVSHL